MTRPWGLEHKVWHMSGTRACLERELTEREPDPNKGTNKRNAEAGKRREEKGQEGGKAERMSKGEEKGEHRREEGEEGKNKRKSRAGSLPQDNRFEVRV